MVWIEWCQHSGHRLKWEYVPSLVKQAHFNGDPNVTQKEIDLAYGLRDLRELINLLINHMFFNSWSNNLYTFNIIVGETPQGYIMKWLSILHQRVGWYKRICDSRISAVF